MGVLADGPAPSRPMIGEGKALVDIYRAMDDDDRALIRKWAADPDMTIMEIWRRLSVAFPISRTTVRHGLGLLEAAAWEC